MWGELLWGPESVVVIVHLFTFSYKQLLLNQWIKIIFLRWPSFKIVQRIKFYEHVWLLQHQKEQKMPRLRRLIFLSKSAKLFKIMATKGQCLFCFHLNIVITFFGLEQLDHYRVWGELSEIKLKAYVKH